MGVRVFWGRLCVCCIHVQPCTPPPQLVGAGVNDGGGGGVSVWLHLGLMHTFILLHSQNGGQPWPLSVRAKAVGMSGNGFQAWGITWPETFFVVFYRNPHTVMISSFFLPPHMKVSHIFFLTS